MERKRRRRRRSVPRMLRRVVHIEFRGMVGKARRLRLLLML
jgi:hypothetical protein